MARQYPIWVDMVNNSYNSSKSYGVNDYAIQHVAIGTSSKNSFDFVKIEISVQDNYDEDGLKPTLTKTYQLRVDGELIKQAVYNLKTKKMEIEDVKTSNFVQSENALKVKYFKKWKDEDEDKAQDFRNERLAHRQAVNGH
jgi:hypothetical protein